MSLNLLFMPKRGVTANLALHFRQETDGNATLLDICTQEPPLRVVRGFMNTEGEALVHLHNLSGGVLGGDQLGLSIHVGTNAKAQVTSTGSTRLYRHRHGECNALQQTTINVAAGGMLEYLPDTLIPFAGSRYRQCTKIALAENAGLFYWEIITPGREALGELFHYEWLRLDLDICAGGRPIAGERVQLEPTSRPLSSLMRLGQFRYFTTFYVCCVGVAASNWLTLEAALDACAAEQSVPDETLWGVSTLSAHGLVIRGLGMNSRTLQHGLLCFWQVAKRELYGREAIMPRKIY
ncbi:MAG: urease accessory protein UreD [Caldilineaceae bacterium]